MAQAGKLTSSADFRRIYAEGKRASSDALAAHVLATAEERPARVGVTAVRGLGGAVERNLAKRRLREAVRAVRGEIREGADVVVVATPSALTTSFQEMVDSLRRVLAEAGGCR
ncbi:MAG TPA: ribonuclease P protein component [Actinomycetota bacterium]|nr:ribonuclease P protein component [Actinomycetota bacterium]